jgi:(p)ppGpp synthase/HD superfamily hydrolase
MSNEPVMAECIARIAHRRQKEESTGEPYIWHVERVVALVQRGTLGHYLREEAAAVAWLHDVVEDSDILGDAPDYSLLAGGFSEQVVEAVMLLTRGWHVAKSASYEEYIRSIHESGNELARAVKLADLSDHLRPNCPERLRLKYERALEALTGASAVPGVDPR